ncbi:unnamed protein product [Clavelina lepadiformis]|uniref:Sulfatase N-terminal domain-containing protein n=1 Tax=Clavelina lepadiformis TaxID=159417 RepID=A0ABP0F2I2_CLALP
MVIAKYGTVSCLWLPFVMVTLCCMFEKGEVFGQTTADKPNIVFILADDYGYNDIGYHAIKHNSSMKTPFLDSLALAGVKLENYYVQPICTPSRSQLMSGKYQIHTGLQHLVITPPQPNGLGLDNIILPQQLKHCGYSTYMVGKWHLGFYKTEYLPWNRGFDYYYGYLTGGEDYYTKYRCFGKLCGYDMTSLKGPTNETYGEYSAHLFARKTEEVIKAHDKTHPMFLYVALQSVHSPMEVPESYAKPFSWIKNKNRRIHGGMILAMDEAVKNITNSLKSAGMWDNTLLIFSTDNGGQVFAGGNNWPLRGNKVTLWEGGIRGVGFVHGSMLKVPNPNTKPNTALIHISDWLPTILSAAKCPLISGSQQLDGFDQWDTIQKYTPSKRSEILHNIDPLNRVPIPDPHSMFVRKGFNTLIKAAIRMGDWKLITGNPGFEKWVEPPELKNEISDEVLTTDYENDKNLPSKTVHLFNIAKDPYERNELSQQHPDIVDILLTRLAAYNQTAVPVRYPAEDPRCDPKLHGGFWQPWEN